jgi:hypothetical protein
MGEWFPKNDSGFQDTLYFTKTQKGLAFVINDAVRHISADLISR